MFSFLTALVKREALKCGAFDATVTDNWALGGEGAQDLAEAVIKACDTREPNTGQFLYELHLSIKVSLAALLFSPLGTLRVLLFLCIYYN